MQARLLKLGGLAVLLLALLWLTSTPAQAATVTVNLCASDGTLNLPGGASVNIWGYVNTNGGPCTTGLVTSLPGPEIRAAAGDTVIINLTNALAESTSIVIAGQTLTASGGAPGPLAQEAGPGGGTVSYSFTAKAGAYLYESGSNASIQLAMGLYGALAVQSANPAYAGVTHEAVLVLSEIDPALNADPSGFNLLNYRPRYFLINGKAYPDTAPISVSPGARALLRYLNAGFDHYAMAILGAHQRVIARNGFVLTNGFRAVAETVPAGESMDALVDVPAGAAVGATLPLYNRNLYVTNNGAGPGGMFTTLTVASGPPPPPPPPPPASDLIFVSSSSNGAVNGLSFADEDILVYNPGTGAWAMVFDGSDVGVGGTDVNGFAFLEDGTILMTFDNPVTLNGLGTVDDSDIVRFTPTSLGSTTAGTFTLFFDGSDVGLTTNDEDIDAIGFTPDGRLVVSTLGNFSVPGPAGTTVSGADEDLIVFDATSLGADTSGTWELYFDGSDVVLTAGSEDIWGVSIDSSDGKIYLTTQGAFAVNGGVSGDGADIFICTPGALGATTSCTWSAFWDGSAHGFSGEVADGIEVGNPPIVFAASAGHTGVEADSTPADPNDDPMNGDTDDTAEEGTAEAQHQIYLPVISR